jgi:ATP/maltotriose-dependent transcriptional regulator MalT
LQASADISESFVRGIGYGLLGTVQWLRADAPGAETSLREAVRIQAQTAHRWGLLTTLETLAWVVTSAGQLERAALLLGSTAAMSQQLGVPLFPYGAAQVHHDACAEDLRAGLGPSRYHECWRQGQALAPEEVLALALQQDPTSAGPDRAAPRAAEHSLLSARESEVARLVADGLSNPAIAAALFVSAATVKTHVSHILAKLHLESRAQIAAWVADSDAGAAAVTRR